MPPAVLSLRCHESLPGFAFGKLVDLVLEVDDDLLMLLLKEMGSLLRFQVDIFQ